MAIFNSSVIKNSIIKKFFSGAVGCLHDLPSWQRKVEAVFLGAELLACLREDNDWSDFWAGRITVSQSTLARLLDRILEQVSDVKLVSVLIGEGYVLCKLWVDRGPGGLQITVKAANIRLFLQGGAPHIKADMVEFPAIKPGIPLAAFFCSIFTWLAQKIVGSGGIYRRVTRGVPGLQVEGNTFKLYLMQVPGLADKISREVLGIRVLDVFNIDRVELKNGKIQIYGGPKIPDKLIRKSRPLQ